MFRFILNQLSNNRIGSIIYTIKFFVWQVDDNARSRNQVVTAAQDYLVTQNLVQ